jgi:hypothetical protein
MHRNYFSTGFAVSLVIILLSCNNQSGDKTPVSIVDTNTREKFEPADGEVILFVGQELESIGGTDAYTDGYFDHYPAAGGFTQYTDFLTGIHSFSFVHKGLDGLTTLDDWGDGPENMAVTVADPDFKNSCLSIGLDISQGNDSLTAIGEHDMLIYKLANWIKALGERPVFLRIGYEFDGFSWNHYKQEFYIPAWKRIKSKLDSMGVNNVAYVWQSKGRGSKREEMDAFYPGDDLVDWVAYSFFSPEDANHPMIQFARDHKKPLFIAESSPVFLDSNNVCKPLDLTRQTDAEWAWKDWFIPYFHAVKNNPDVVKAIHYINAPWKSRPMWKGNNHFKNIDARITKNDSLKTWWLKETSQTMYLKASDTLFSYLWRK